MTTAIAPIAAGSAIPTAKQKPRTISLEEGMDMAWRFIRSGMQKRVWTGEKQVCIGPVNFNKLRSFIFIQRNKKETTGKINWILKEQSRYSKDQETSITMYYTCKNRQSQVLMIYKKQHGNTSKRYRAK